jgi:UDP-N-acetylglucosamine 2-epimerase (non-hydrolysing)
MNRQLTARLSDIHFAPTEQAKSNLIKENIDTDSILVTGNTVIDALFESIQILKESNLSEVGLVSRYVMEGRPIVLVTANHTRYPI